MESPRPPIRNAPVTIVLIAEAAAAAPLTRPAIDTWLAALSRFPSGSQLLVMNDGRVIDAPIAPQLRIVHHPSPRGLGASAQTAIWSTTTPLIFFAPFATLANDCISEFFEKIDRADLVVGCRGAGPIPGVVRAGDVARNLASWIFLGGGQPLRLAWPGWQGWRQRWTARHLFGVSLHDPGSGIVLARREIFARIPIQSSGNFTWVEIAAKANHLGCLLDEIAVPHWPRQHGRFGSDAARLFRDPDFGPRDAPYPAPPTSVEA